jgi:hypothetical protein
VLCFACAYATSAAAQQPAPAKPSLSGLLGAQRSTTTAAEPELSEIAAQLDGLSRRPDAQAVLAVIAQGRRAIEAAHTALGRAEAKSAARSKQIAWAALALASRKLAAVSAAHEKAAAERRAQAAEAELARAERALEEASSRLASMRATTR